MVKFLRCLLPNKYSKSILSSPSINEAGIVEQTHAQVRDVIDSLSYDFQFIYVDDGSNDGTVDTLRKIAGADPRITVLQLSRNFGHQAALTAGMDASRGDVVITMDGDGQHPPELIPQNVGADRAGI